MKRMRGATTIVQLVYVIIMFAAIYGWIMNLVYIVNGSWNPITGFMILRVIGVFVAFIGAVLGWIPN